MFQIQKYTTFAYRSSHKGMPQLEDNILHGLNNKSKNAFKMLFDTYYNSLVLFACKFVNDIQVAEDVVQDIFVAVWEKEEKFLSITSIKTYLYNSVRNKCLNIHNRKKVEEKYKSYTLFTQDGIDDIDAIEIENEVYRRLFATIEELPDRCKDVFKLHLEGKSNDEIAEILKISRNTAKSQKVKAKNIIKEKLGSLHVYLIFSGIL